jgi:hypothetical protein
MHQRIEMALANFDEQSTLHSTEKGALVAKNKQIKTDINRLIGKN